jgi:radical SAM protein with 4Fe4S-binding SPASM domain
MTIPKPTWIELSPSDMCTRKCVECPKWSDIAPGQALYMHPSLAGKISADLTAIGFNGTIVLAGYGEPLCHPDLVGLANQLRPHRVELVTNGDLLTKTKVHDLYYHGGIAKISVSCHDQDRALQFMAMSGIRGLESEVRNRWDPIPTLTNRAIGNGKPGPCWYPCYSMTIDWDGRVHLCPQDWQRRVAVGNVSHQSILEVWNGPLLSRRRKDLLDGDRSSEPCKSCDCKGTMKGRASAMRWKRAYSKK